jgi:putative flippase GtrA
MTVLARARQAPAPRTRRPAVVESIGSPQSISDGRTIRTTNRSIVSQIGRFAAIGVVSTLAWAGLYSLLRGAGLGSVAANGIALIVTAIGNTAANRRLTFGITGRQGLVRDHGAGLVAFVLAIALTTASAASLDAVLPDAGRLVELAVLTTANLVATAGRFALLHRWVGRGSPVCPA